MKKLCLLGAFLFSIFAMQNVNAFDGYSGYGACCPQPEAAPCDQFCGECYCRYVRYDACPYTIKRCVQEPCPCTKKCCRYVPQYYQVTKCRYVPEYYNVTCCKQVCEYFDVPDCKFRTRVICEPACRYVPRYYWKRECCPPQQTGCPSY